MPDPARHTEALQAQTQQPGEQQCQQCIQQHRAEQHAAHHEYEVHGRNYGDLPLWDLLFGTFYNPARFEGRVGFDAPASARLADMLLMRDVNEAPAAPAPMQGVQS